MSLTVLFKNTPYNIISIASNGRESKGKIVINDDVIPLVRSLLSKNKRVMIQDMSCNAWVYNSTYNRLVTTLVDKENVL